MPRSPGRSRLWVVVFVATVYTVIGLDSVAISNTFTGLSVVVGMALFGIFTVARGKGTRPIETNQGVVVVVIFTVVLAGGAVGGAIRQRMDNPVFAIVMILAALVQLSIGSYLVVRLHRVAHNNEHADRSVEQ